MFFSIFIQMFKETTENLIRYCVLVLHCLLISHKKKPRLIRVKVKISERLIQFFKLQ